MNIRATLIATLGAMICSLSSFSAFAQWQWLDETGRKTYSDRPPPAHIPDKNILARPPGANVRQPAISLPKADVPDVASQSETAAAVPSEASSVPAQPTAEELKRQKEEAAQKAAEAAKQAEENARIALQRQENCNRAQASLRTLQSDVPLAEIGADGQQTTMSDAKRQQSIQRAQGIVARDCGPMRVEN